MNRSKTVATPWVSGCALLLAVSSVGVALLALRQASNDYHVDKNYLGVAVAAVLSAASIACWFIGARASRFRALSLAFAVASVGVGIYTAVVSTRFFIS